MLAAGSLRNTGGSFLSQASVGHDVILYGFEYMGMALRKKLRMFFFSKGNANILGIHLCNLPPPFGSPPGKNVNMYVLGLFS